MITGILKRSVKGILWCLNCLIPRERLDENADGNIQRIREKARTRTDISDHLETLYRLVIQHHCQLVMELGVRTGDSSTAFERAVRKTGGWLISVDIDDTTFHSDYDRWRFVRSDDIDFARDFSAFAGREGCPQQVDLLFVDTTHEYEQTVAELDAWMPLLSPSGLLVLHDTNMKRIFRRRDGSFGFGWNNRRGVIRAVEELVGRTYDETQAFTDIASGFRITHDPWCNGLTVLERVPDTGN